MPDHESSSRTPEYEKALDEIEARARRGEFTLAQVRQAIHELRRRMGVAHVPAAPPRPEGELPDAP